MKEEALVLSAQKLQQPSEASTKVFYEKIDIIAEKLNHAMLSRPDIERLVGTDNINMMENNSRNYLRFMGAMFHSYDPLILVQTSLWAFRIYRSHGFFVEYWPANLDTTVEILKKELPSPVYQEIYPFFEWLIVNIPAFVDITEKLIREGASLERY
ncbi:hypothetical protein ACKUB1_09190 [Methanospirillum stamsii]|uniref:Uncharacterized protein n=1 Tax=Methanospirillum stamsii TaxID=1277351 RepID=A0A2V2N5T2_9EURY|nr:hypothetical protein [Methanospirillum stamsii]PWR75432.1 hypothetical protein DLD82_04660 [Methanospirillum stamsii]